MDTFGECETLVNDRLIVLREKRSRILFRNPGRGRVRRILIDGCVIKQGLRCDYLLINQAALEHYVELKGSDVRHALKQIATTIRQVSTHPSSAHKKAFIITTRCPLHSPEIQQHQLCFRKTYGTTLIIRSSGFETDL